MKHVADLQRLKRFWAEEQQHMAFPSNFVTSFVKDEEKVQKQKGK